MTQMQLVVGLQSVEMRKEPPFPGLPLVTVAYNSSVQTSAPANEKGRLGQSFVFPFFHLQELVLCAFSTGLGSEHTLGETQKIWPEQLMDTNSQGDEPERKKLIDEFVKGYWCGDLDFFKHSGCLLKCSGKVKVSFSLVTRESSVTPCPSLPCSTNVNDSQTCWDCLDRDAAPQRGALDVSAFFSSTQPSQVSRSISVGSQRSAAAAASSLDHVSRSQSISSHRSTSVAPAAKIVTSAQRAGSSVNRSTSQPPSGPARATSGPSRSPASQTRSVRGATAGPSRPSLGQAGSLVARAFSPGPTGSLVARAPSPGLRARVPLVARAPGLSQLSVGSSCSPLVQHNGGGKLPPARPLSPMRRWPSAQFSVPSFAQTSPLPSASCSARVASGRRSSASSPQRQVSRFTNGIRQPSRSAASPESRALSLASGDASRSTSRRPQVHRGIEVSPVFGGFGAERQCKRLAATPRGAQPPRPYSPKAIKFPVPIPIRNQANDGEGPRWATVLARCWSPHGEDVGCYWSPKTASRSVSPKVRVRSPLEGTTDYPCSVSHSLVASCASKDTEDYYHLAEDLKKTAPRVAETDKVLADLMEQKKRELSGCLAVLREVDKRLLLRTSDLTKDNGFGLAVSAPEMCERREGSEERVPGPAEISGCLGHSLAAESTFLSVDSPREIGEVCESVS